MFKNVAILGSTGSIGQNTLRVIDSLGGEYKVYAISARNSIEKLAEQVRRYKPKFVAVTIEENAAKLAKMVGDIDVEILSGPGSLVEIAENEKVDTVVTAIVGAAGLPAVLAAAGKGKRIALANKEPMVIAGELLTAIAKENGAEILPVDSEHSAVFQAIQSGRADEVKRIILTASGGPFRGANAEDIKNVTLEQALEHPVWDMGPKITIDSATMMNKALEVIEARWLFDVGADKIDVLIHPESIVHSLVEFVDNSVIAQLGLPDMCLPIQYALSWPKRVEGIAKRLNLEEIGKLTFEKPDLEVFGALRMGFEVAKVGGTAAAVFNAANEAAVELFIDGKIKFADITELIERCLNKHSVEECVSLEQLLEADEWARREVENSVELKA